MRYYQTVNTTDWAHSFGQRPISLWLTVNIDEVYTCFVYKSTKNGKVYVGFSQKAPEHRLLEHNSGNSTWTKINGPFKLIYYEQYHCKEDAMQREKFYKSGFGKRIKKLIIEEIVKGP